MEKMLLKDPEIQPTPEVLEVALGSSFAAFEKLNAIITSKEYGVVPEWRYYRDGKAWLCKNVYKKKTVFWLSVWDGFFKVAFYFTERTGSGIKELEIDDGIKREFRKREPIGKLLPLVVTMEKVEQVPDVVRIIEYKISAK